MHVNDTLSDYNLEALMYYVRACKDAFSSEEYHTIQNDIRLKCMDYITEDYWRAKQNKNTPRMQEMNRQYKRIRTSLLKNGVRLKIKFLLFDMNPLIFVIARYAFEMKKLIGGLL
ncbi:MAG: hypothetical protein IKQ49_02115 [Eubacterium sp.]|nr:hypothetical protein [Eubacterium sp.]